ncbi:hypothetical protein SDJN02_15676, partial [Cucurbita argyrosperma subsp. argyrosperma]
MMVLQMQPVCTMDNCSIFLYLLLLGPSKSRSSPKLYSRTNEFIPMLFKRNTHSRNAIQ